MALVSNVGVTVFLVSLKAGGVALNLTEASRVYLMDSWWNPAVRFHVESFPEFLTCLMLRRLNIVCVLCHVLPSSDVLDRGYGSDSSSWPT